MSASATTVSETNTRGPLFVKYRPFDAAVQSRLPRDGSRLEGGPVLQLPRPLKTAVSATRDTANRPSGETSDDYPGVVAVIDGGRSRVIVCSSGVQWIVQHRQGDHWRSNSYCRTREALIRCCGGSTPELDALPERIGDRVAPTTDGQAAQ